MMQFRRFNDKGIAAFRAYLDALRLAPAAPVPTGFLTDPGLAEPLPQPIAATLCPFPNRMAFARWLHDAAHEADAEVPRQDAGFWAWLSLALFDQVCPADGRGRRKVKEEARYIPVLLGSRRYYRHALLGPYLIFYQHRHMPDRVTALLSGTLQKLTDEAYRLFVENQLVGVSSAVRVLNDLYFDPDRGRIRRGAQTKKPGSIRRLVRVLGHYSRTHDLDVLDSGRLLDMLPSEFNRWKDHASMFR